ncbi:FecR domain-containing protein [Halomonas faecis]|uniref:FecR domain-containing protein n=1 Tax=Halomonas faecis TaxID=1562110 RepID=UPI0013D6DDA7|nr:FecR domain-containing protein [Halomonas faecis]
MVRSACSEDTAKRRALAEAADWFAEWQAEEFSPTQRERWQAWLEASDTHRWAWQQMEAVGRRFTGQLEEPERQTAAGVIGQARQRRRGRRHLLGGLAGLALIAVLAGALWQITPLPQMAQRWGADHRTGTGEVARIVLEDGTQVWLNSASALDVDYDDAQRRLVLVSGEVLVDTARDPERPLHLDTTQARLTPLGTRFSVRQRTGDELLAVFEGAVTLQPHERDETAASPVVVQAGQQVAYSARDIGTPTAAEGARAAWVDGLLLAESMPLDRFAAQLDAHHLSVIQVDPAVADLTLLGVYPLHDLERTLSMVESALSVRARRVLPGWIRIEPIETP